MHCDPFVTSVVTLPATTQQPNYMNLPVPIKHMLQCESGSIQIETSFSMYGYLNKHLIKATYQLFKHHFLSKDIKKTFHYSTFFEYISLTD